MTMNDLFAPSALTGPEVLSVSGLNQRARALLERQFPDVAVAGELSNFVCPASGHWYFSLKDQRSQLRCAMFATRNRLVKFQPEDGGQVVVHGRLSIYEGRGDYQLIAERITESGAGALRRAFEELKAKLQQEGLFAAEHKQEIWNLYQHIGLITSATGAALHDLLTVFGRRFPATRLTLIPTAVQGAEAPAQIVQAIRLANRLQPKLGLQVLIVGRGGGSLEDLQAFNDEAVARAIFASKLPIVSAVGHEVDYTIADFVADLRAATPSAAAEQLSLDQADLQEDLHAWQQQLRRQLQRQLTMAQQQLHALSRQLKRPDRRLQERAQHLDNLELRLRRAVQAWHQTTTAQLHSLHDALLAASPAHRLSAELASTINIKQRAQRAMAAILHQQRAQLSEFSRSLHAVSPLQTLTRGYSLSYDAANNLVRDLRQVTPGSKLCSILAKGQIISTVDSVSPRASEQPLVRPNPSSNPSPVTTRS